jgi:hypothetical protein
VTSYIVLKQKAPSPPNQSGDNGAGGWFVVGPPVESASAEAAIRKAVDGDKGGTYVAVPLRSWAPIEVKVETTRVLKLQGAAA